MKNKICFILTISFVICILFPSGASSTEYERDLQWSATRLEQLGIVKNFNERWTENSPITRRDLFKMAYIAKTGSRAFYVSEEDGLEKAEKYILDIKKNYNTDLKYDDIIIGSPDYYFVTSLFVAGLIAGKQENEYNYMALDEYATYEEAFHVIIRLFISWQSLKSVDQDINAYEILQKMNLINSQNPFDMYSLQIPSSAIKNRISAYEFMHLLYNSLYLPLNGNYDNGAPTYRYIDRYFNNGFLDSGIINEDRIDITD